MDPEKRAAENDGPAIVIPLKSERKPQNPIASAAYAFLGLIVVGAMISAFFWLLE